jgi:hypothetical protein
MYSIPHVNPYKHYVFFLLDSIIEGVAFGWKQVVA